MMVADKGPLYAYVDIPLKNQPFPATIVNYNIKQCLHCMSDQFDVNGQKCAFLSKTRTFLSDPKLLNGSAYFSYQLIGLFSHHLIV